METFTVIILIAVGILLILLEFFAVPGITVFGIGGLGCMIAGVYIAYDFFGQIGGLYALLGAAGSLGAVLYFAFKSKTWDKVMLKKKIESKVESTDEDAIKVGDTGKTISRLAPIGKIQVGDKYYEGKSIDKFIDQDEEIVVVKVLKTQIIVKPKK